MELGAQSLKNVVQRPGGFTLVELMVAMSLAIVDGAHPRHAGAGAAARACRESNSARAAGRRRFACEL
ncbi:MULTISPECIES: prepilin-type N-terminal cleavage/methylation domain-containing protein [Burkholderia]|uniref:prepilin-type N-terminal cleavage/methylation domain-containing protein n=1 Tax=Burkholderia TaxID=32008 RepID=UPI001E5F46F3|nr:MULTISPECIES: prepilin-type N-terminal cleavage/methylation domain-containing protein [Burkholderia]